MLKSSLCVDIFARENVSFGQSEQLERLVVSNQACVLIADKLPFGETVDWDFNKWLNLKWQVWGDNLQIQIKWQLCNHPVLESSAGV